MMMCLLYELAWRLGSRVAEGLRGDGRRVMW